MLRAVLSNFVNKKPATQLCWCHSFSMCKLSSVL